MTSVSGDAPERDAWKVVLHDNGVEAVIYSGDEGDETFKATIPPANGECGTGDAMDLAQEIVVRWNAYPALLTFVEKVKDGWRNTYGNRDAAEALGEACVEAGHLLTKLFPREEGRQE